MGKLTNKEQHTLKVTGAMTVELVDRELFDGDERRVSDLTREEVVEIARQLQDQAATYTYTADRLIMYAIFEQDVTD